ncbi:MAG: hypothetical protein KH020_20915 [Clostridiales bacterium]|nr:hypothetical protein [Clostridiales bacterium]
MVSTVLIYNKDIGFFRITEGTGDNLLREDKVEGYVDYLLLEELEYDGQNSLDEVDGTQVMFTELYQEKFQTVEELLEYLILETGFLPDEPFQILYAE